MFAGSHQKCARERRKFTANGQMQNLQESDDKKEREPTHSTGCVLFARIHTGTLVHRIVGQNSLGCQKKVSGTHLKTKYFSSELQVHNKVRNFNCPICEVSFGTKHVLRMHMETHKPSSERVTKFTCSYCGKVTVFTCAEPNRSHCRDHST